jgi:mevalonate pyrophosphate decarboxylase
MYTDDLKKVVTAAIQGRYGDKGSQATFQWIQEQNPTVDPSMYKKIQQVIEAFRNEFQQAQTEMLQMRNNYENALGYVWQGMWLSLAGYPKIDLAQFKIVTTDKARQTFETKRDTGIQLRPAN